MSAEMMAPARSTAVLAHANPVSKLAASLVLALVLIFSVDWVSGSVALLCELAILPLAGLAVSDFLRRAWPLIAAAIVGGYATALLAPDTGAMLLTLGPATFSEGSLEAGLAIMLRGLAIALPGVLLLASTDPTDLADGLAQKVRLPHRFVLGALAAMRLVGLLVEEWQTLGMARRARGVGGGRSPYGRIRQLLGQSFALLVQAIRRATKLAVTMEARGFGGEHRTWARTSHFALIDLWVFAGGVLIAALAVTAAVVLGTWNPIF